MTNKQKKLTYYVAGGAMFALVIVLILAVIFKKPSQQTIENQYNIEEPKSLQHELGSAVIEYAKEKALNKLEEKENEDEN